MSTGNLDLTSPVKLEQKKEIPPSWFYGIGDENHGIMAVNFSIELHKIGAEKIQEVTGFSMEEFEAEKKKLEEQYKGKKDAPFKFELHPNLGSFAARK